MSRGRVQGFQKDRLTQILAVRRLTQVQLAAMVGVSPSTINKWRFGTQLPEHEALERLASVVNVTPEWFTRTPGPKLPPPLFRSNAKALVSAMEMFHARLEWVQEIVDALSEYVDFPHLNLPARNYATIEEISDEEIERAACECRDLWRLGRSVIQDISLSAEGAGVILVREETGVAQIDGLSSWSEAQGRPLILLSADKDNGYRGRFDLAHEIGHVILHRSIKRSTKRTMDSARYSLMEKQAHRFAGAFLLPAETFATEVPVPPTLDDLLLLKRRWGVSVAAMIMRLRALDILSEDGALMLYKRRSARWGVKSEPGDGDLKPEKPRLLRRTIELLVEEKVMPLEGIHRYFGLAETDIEALVGLPTGYFHRNDNVVQFSRLRSVIENSQAYDAKDKTKIMHFRVPRKT